MALAELLCRMFRVRSVNAAVHLIRLLNAFGPLRDTQNLLRPEQVRTNVQYTLEALGLLPSTSAAAEQKAAQSVASLLEHVMNQTWSSGRPENN